MASVEEIRRIADQVSARTKLYDQLLCSPDAELAFLGGVERTLGRIDAVMVGRYRSLILSAANLSRAVSRAEQNPDVDLVRELRSELRDAALPLGVDPKTVGNAVRAVFNNGVSMLENGFTDIKQLDNLRNRTAQFNRGSYKITEGTTFTASKEGPPSTIKTGLQRNIL